MKNATMLDLGNSKVHEIEFISSMQTGSTILIEMIDERALSEVAAEFEGNDKLVVTDTIKPGVSTVYDGYTELIDIRRNQINGSVRLTLSKP